MRLKDKVCLITGSSMGIGKAIAERFAEEGAIVIINSRKQDQSDVVAEELKAKGYRADAIACDVTNKDSVFKMVEAIVKKFGKIDVLVNNAGINYITDSLTLEEADFKHVLDVDLAGVLFCCQAAGKYMIDNGGGVIINTASSFSHGWTYKRAAYSAAKTGLLGLSNVLAVEWAKNNIRVNCVAPGWMKSNMNETDQVSGGYTDEDIYRRTPMGRYGTAREVANVMLFLASDDASFVTGSCYDVDGGWHAFGGWC